MRRVLIDRALKTRAVALVVLLAVALLAPTDALAKKKKKKKGQGELSGVVMSQAGEVLAEALVTLSGTAGSDFRDEAKTDGKGKFAIAVPAAGTYMMRLEREGYTAFENQITFDEGEKQAVEIKMIDASTGSRNTAVKAYNAGAKAYEARDMATAKQQFLAATEADPTLPEPFLVLADIYLIEGAYREAADAADKFLAMKPGDSKAQMFAYEAYQKLGDQAKVDELRQALAGTEAAPQLAIQVFNEGALANQRGDIATAIAKFRSALDFNPELAEAHAALASVYYNEERYDEALASVNKTLELKPDHVPAHRVRFLIHDALGNREDAEQAMSSYIEHDADAAADLLYRRADLDFRDGSPDLARSQLLRVLEIKPDMARAYYTLGLILMSSDTTQAKEHLRKFIEMAPDDPEAPVAQQMLDSI
ncbi:MAG: tetratricopeptide repeat protein [Acidobacteriota bacterium]